MAAKRSRSGQLPSTTRTTKKNKLSDAKASKPYVMPEKKDTESSYGVNQKRAEGMNVSNYSEKEKVTAVKKDNYPDPEGKGFEGVNNEILDVWMNDIRSVVGMQSLKKLGTGIPYIFNIAGDLLINPSTVSPSTYKKIVESDDVVNAAMTNTIDEIINTLGPVIHSNKEIQDHLRTATMLNKRGFRTMCRDILTALYAGFSRQECVWDFCSELGADIIYETVPLPQNSLVYRVDPYGELQEEGVGQYVFNSFYPGFSSLFSYGIGNVFAPLLGNAGSYFPFCNNQNGYGTQVSSVDPYASLGDLDTPYRTYLISPIGLVWIPTAKTIGFEYYNASNNKNPYGKPPRQIYNLWVFKLAVMEFFLEMLKKKSAPLLVGYSRPDVPSGPMNPNVPNQFVQNGAFNPGNFVQSATAQMTNALGQANSSAGISLAGMKGEVFDLEAIQIQGELMIFLETLKWVNDCILTALRTPKTTFGADGKGSHALSYTQADVHARYVMSVRTDLIECLRLQYFKPMIIEAFTSEEHQNDWGSFDIKRTSIDDQVKLSGIYKEMTEAGVIFNKNLDDVNQMRENLGLPKLDEADFEELSAEAEKDKQALEEAGAPEGSVAAKGKKSSGDKRKKMDSTEKPYAHHKDK